MFVRNEQTALKMVVGASIPLTSGFNPKSTFGWIASTTNPKTNISVLNSIMATAYCFQFCGPVSTRCSIQRRNRGA